MVSKDEIIEMAREAWLRDCTCDGTKGCLERFAALVADAEAKRIYDEGMVTVGHMREQIGAETKRADALAAVVAKLRDIVTSDAESKADFIARVRDVLGACPDQRVLHAVAVEREACAKVCETLGVHPALNVYAGGPDWYKHGKECAAAIRARSK